MDKLGHWQYDGEWPKNCFGFIYEIKNKTTGMKYIGKKQVQKIIKRPPLKGKKNKRHVITESDWKTYTGSSNELNEAIKTQKKTDFAFTILRICYNKWELSYYEAELQFKLGVLLSSKYYNGIINCRIGKKPKTNDHNRSDS
tara:strand:+ start:166 stop:591 length:426 start_codon:yes stop_codon:yes gene_type:complete